MFTRSVTFTKAKHIDAGLEFVRDVATPVLQQQKGYAGTITSADRANGLLGVLSRWETAADRDASESALLKVREEGLEVIGGTMSVEHFDEVLLEVVGGPPRAGTSLLVSRATMDPAQVGANLEYFAREVLPQILKDPGLLFVRQLVNRETGDALVGTGWVDAAAMQAGLERAKVRNQGSPVTITDRSLREVLFVDLV